MNESGSECILSPYSVAPNDLGLDASDLHNIDSSNPSTERDDEPLNYIKSSDGEHKKPPEIVAAEAAYKRSLMLADCEFDMLDSWQKTVLRCAPIANFDETMNEFVSRDNNNDVKQQLELTENNDNSKNSTRLKDCGDVMEVMVDEVVRLIAERDNKLLKRVRFDEQLIEEVDEEEEEEDDDNDDDYEDAVEIDQTTYTPSCESDDNAIDDDYDMDGIQEIACDENTNAIVKVLDTVRYTIELPNADDVDDNLICVSCDNARNVNIENKDDEFVDGGGGDDDDDGIQLNVDETVQCADSNNHYENNISHSPLKSSQSSSSLVSTSPSAQTKTATTTTATKLPNPTSNNFSTITFQCNACAVKLTHSSTKQFGCRSKFTQVKKFASIENNLDENNEKTNDVDCGNIVNNEKSCCIIDEKKKNNVQDSFKKSNETISSTQPTDKDDSSLIGRSFKNSENTVKHIKTNQLSSELINSVDIIVKENCENNENCLEQQDTSDPNLNSSNKNTKIKNNLCSVESANEIVEKNQKVEKNNCDSENNFLKIKFPPSISQDNVIVLLENLSLSKKSENFLSEFSTAHNNNTSSVLKLSEKNLKKEHQQQEKQEGQSPDNKKRSTSCCTNSGEDTTPKGGDQNQKVEKPTPNTSPSLDLFTASNRLQRLEERFRDFYYTKKLLRDFHSSVNSLDEPITEKNNKNYDKVCEKENNKNGNARLTSTSLEDLTKFFVKFEKEKCEREVAEKVEKNEKGKKPREKKEDDLPPLQNLATSPHLPSSSPPTVPLPTTTTTTTTLSSPSLSSFSSSSSIPCLQRERRESSSKQENNTDEKQQENLKSSLLSFLPLSKNRANSLSPRIDRNNCAHSYKHIEEQQDKYKEKVENENLSSSSSALFKKKHTDDFCSDGVVEKLNESESFKRNRPSSDIWQQKIETLKQLEDNLNKCPSDELNLPTPEPSTDSEEVSKFFPDLDTAQPPLPTSSPPADDDDDDNINYESILAGDIYTNCEFDVRHLGNYGQEYGRVYECYDELEDSVDDLDETNDDNDDDDDECEEDNESCNCSLEAVPLYVRQPEPLNMRETAGPLRGLLKKPNRPPPLRKNRVVFDETRNEFFEADYIILIREDCPYDEEDEEPCTCGEHELVRLCCEEGCQCPGYTNDECNRTPQSPKFAPPIEFVDQATLSPPEGYKDGGALQNALGGALGGHVFGAQHIQQLQVIQRLQQQRAAMLAARAGNQNATVPVAPGQPIIPGGQISQPGQPILVQNNVAQTVCTECAECAECAAKQLQDSEECESPCSEDVSPLDVSHVALVPIQTTSPERRITAKEIIAGEERPKYLSIKQYEASTTPADDGLSSKNQRYIVETITMTTVTERRIVREAASETPALPPKPTKLQKLQKPKLGIATIKPTAVLPSSTGTTNNTNTANATIGAHGTGSQPQSQLTTSVATTTQPDKITSSIGDGKIVSNSNSNPNINSLVNHHQGVNSVTAAIAGILKGGKLWKNETTQCDESTNITSDDECGSKRSVRFNETVDDKLDDTISERDICDGEATTQTHTEIIDGGDQNDKKPPLPVKKHTSLFHNALRPNSAVRQLFPAANAATVTVPAVVPTTATPLTLESLKAFEEAKRSSITKVVHSDSETDTIKRTIERNALRRSLIKYEPKKKPQRMDTSLEERIRKLTCDIDDPINDQELEKLQENGQLENELLSELERRDSPAGEENPTAQQQTVNNIINNNNTNGSTNGGIKYVPEKSFSPSSSASSSSSGSTSAYRKITEIFHRDRRQERIPEADENPIVIIPQQDCRCPAAPDLGMGVQMPATHTQIHQTPPRQNESRRQFLSTLVPLTACVAGQRDDFSYYTLAPGERNSTASSQFSEYSLGDIEAALRDDVEVRKVAPDVIAGTPGQESDELVAFAQQEAPRTERLKKRYSTENSASAPNSGAASDDDEQNDYGFNKRPSVRGIKPRFGSTNEILQQMQAQLSQAGIPQQQQQQQQQNLNQNQIQAHNTLPKTQSHPNQIAKHQIAAAHHQHTAAAWSYYPELPPRAPVDQANANYYQLPARHHSYHGHEEATIYQNCHTVSMEQHHYGHFARSPTRRPESPPPLRNYHQTMVLIPYNTEPYAAHYSSNDQLPVAPQFHRHNVLEYQQVTQQTIRVPMGYPLPGMQLHVVAGRGGGAHPHYAQTFSRVAGRNFQTFQPDGVKYSERGAPEGAASVHPPDCNSIMSPTSAGQGPPTQQQQQQQQPQQLQQPQQQQQQQANSQTNTGNPGQGQQPGSVFYAMNV